MVQRVPPKSVTRNCPPGCAISLRTITRNLLGHAGSSTTLVMPATHVPSRCSPGVITPDPRLLRDQRGSALTSQASVSRIIHSMGRSGVFPAALGRLHERFRTPVLPILLTSAMSLLAFVLDLVPGVGFALTVWLWTSLSGLSIGFGLTWAAVGLVWLAYLTRGFRRPAPQLDLKET